jgi:hypothetical protein
MQSNTASPGYFSPVMMFCATIVVALYWLIGNVINIYASQSAGVVFEILWLPMLLLLFLLPPVSFFCWYKSRFKLNSLYLLSLLISLASLAAIMIKK